MSEQALDEHLERWEQGQEEMVEVEKGYLDWLEAEVEKWEDIASKEHAESAHTAMYNGEFEGFVHGCFFGLLCSIPIWFCIVLFLIKIF